jgi:hypothetical protein
MKLKVSLMTIAAVLVTAITAFVWHTTASTSSQPKLASVSATQTGVEIPKQVNLVENDGSAAVPVSTSKDDKSREATCENPVVTFTEPVSIDFNNNALVVADQALKKLEKEHGVVATEEQKAAYYKQVAEVLPTTITTEIVFDNNEDTPDDRDAPITDQEVELSDTSYEKQKSKVKQLRCNTKGNSGAQLVSYSTVMYTNTVGWKSCTKTVSFSALNGLKVAQLRLVSEWYNNGYQVPESVSARPTSTAYWVWSKDGEPTVSTRGWQKYSWGVWYSYQNRAWANYKYEVDATIGPIGGKVVLDRGSLYVAAIVGPGGKCV